MPSRTDLLRRYYEKKSNLWHFCRDILDYPDIDNNLHRWLCDEHAKPGRAKAYFLPRGHLKSSIITIGAVIQTVLRNPNVRILLANATEGNACKFLQAIEQHIRTNPIITALWGHLIPQNLNNVRWSAHEMELNRTKIFPEPTIQAIGVGGNLVSRHYDLIIYDDIVNNKNSATDTLRTKCHDWYQMTTPLLEPGGSRWMLGTRYHFEDMYDKVIPDDSWEVKIRKVIERGKFIFPQKFNQQVLDEIKREMKNDYLFQSQYYNDPIDFENATFRQSQIKYYERLPQSHLCFTTVDLALPGKGHDDAVVLTCLTDSDNKLYTYECLHGQMTPSQIVDGIFDHWRRFKPQIIGVEIGGYQGSLIYAIREREERERVVLPIQELKPKGRKKEHRIRALEPRMNPTRPMLFFKRDHEAIIQQLLRFPKGKDDIIDALAYMLDIIFPADIGVTEDEIFETDYEPMFGATGY